MKIFSCTKFWSSRTESGSFIIKKYKEKTKLCPIIHSIKKMSCLIVKWSYFSKGLRKVHVKEHIPFKMLSFCCFPFLEILCIVYFQYVFLTLKHISFIENLLRHRPSSKSAVPVFGSVHKKQESVGPINADKNNFRTSIQIKIWFKFHFSMNLKLPVESTLNSDQ